MGYGIKSPVKQVWLPLEYEYLLQHTNETFGEFSKEYQKKYGIDLHDVFFMEIDETDLISVGAKVDLVGTYNIGLLADSINTKYALTNGILVINKKAQTENVETILTLCVGDVNNNAYGITFVIPSSSTREVKSIDDLQINLYES